MNPKIDTGNIIAVQRFHLYEVDTVYSLTQRCYDYILTLYYDIMSLIILGKELPLTNENWKRKPYTRQELNDLCIITPEMTEDETKRRVKSVTFPNAPGAYIKINGETFLHENILTTNPTPLNKEHKAASLTFHALIPQRLLSSSKKGVWCVGL